MTRNPGQDKAFLLNAPGAQEAEFDSQELIPTQENNTKVLETKMHNNHKLTH